nr:MAG TPA: hypothetical protein [Caudoviricetes sp.]
MNISDNKIFCLESSQEHLISLQGVRLSLEYITKKP